MYDFLIFRTIMHNISCLLFSLVIYGTCIAQYEGKIRTIMLADSVQATIDEPVSQTRTKKTVIIFYALPNGNTTGQTMGKKMKAGDDWHYDIQHIRAQTAFVRRQIPRVNWVVVYLENHYRSWPGWKQRHPDFRRSIPHIIDTLTGMFPARRKEIYLNGHSGGGSFIFGYLAGIEKIPNHVKRISFLDSDYGYDSSYYPRFKHWLKKVKGSALNVFAYNDSVALYNGKPVVSATGGTWYRSRLLLRHLQQDFSISRERDDSIIIFRSSDKRIQFFFRTNPEGKIFHTQQVELNGFIHSILCGTPYDSRNYVYYGPRAYSDLILDASF